MCGAAYEIIFASFTQFWQLSINLNFASDYEYCPFGVLAIPLLLKNFVVAPRIEF